MKLEDEYFVLETAIVFSILITGTFKCFISLVLYGNESAIFYFIVIFSGLF